MKKSFLKLMQTPILGLVAVVCMTLGFASTVVAKSAKISKSKVHKTKITEAQPTTFAPSSLGKGSTSTQKGLLVASNSSTSSVKMDSVATPKVSKAVVVPATATSSLKLEQAPIEKAEKPWAIELGAEHASNMMDSSSPDAQGSTSLSITPSYALTDRLSANGNIAIERQETGPTKGDTQTSDAKIGLSLKGWQLNDSLSTTHSVAGIIPASIDSIGNDRLKGAVSIGNGISAKTSFGDYGYSLGLRKNFHEYTVNADRKANIEWILTNTLTGLTPIWGDFALATSLAYSNKRTYEDFERASFSFNFDLVYQATAACSVNLGFTNEGSALKSNASDSNIQIYNEKTNVLRLGVTYVL